MTREEYYRQIDRFPGQMAIQRCPTCGLAGGLSACSDAYHAPVGTVMVSPEWVARANERTERIREAVSVIRKEPAGTVLDTVLTILLDLTPAPQRDARWDPKADPKDPCLLITYTGRSRYDEEDEQPRRKRKAVPPTAEESQ